MIPSTSDIKTIQNQSEKSESPISSSIDDVKEFQTWVEIGSTQYPCSLLQDSKFGENCKMYEPFYCYGATFGNNVMVGPFVEIQRGVEIGSNTRIQSHTLVCSNVTIGKNCFIGHGVMFINDKFPDDQPNWAKDKFKDTVIENSVTIGSNATILPVRIVANTVIGAGAVVTKDILEPGVYVGNPARKLRDVKSS